MDYLWDYSGELPRTPYWRSSQNSPSRQFVNRAKKLMRGYNPQPGAFECREVPRTDEQALSLLDGYTRIEAEDAYRIGPGARGLPRCYLREGRGHRGQAAQASRIAPVLVTLLRGQSLSKYSWHSRKRTVSASASGRLSKPSFLL
jgi:hypothetical protein